MANYNEQVIRAWDEWEEITGDEANDPDDFIDWALTNHRLYTQPEDIRKIFRRRVSDALRQVHRVDENGTTYRAKQCVSIINEGKQRTLVFDVDKNGTPSSVRRQLSSVGIRSSMTFTAPNQTWST